MTAHLTCNLCTRWIYTAVTYPGPPGEPNLRVPNKQGPNDASFVLVRPVRHAKTQKGATKGATEE